jgi:hypothetical protein
MEDSFTAFGSASSTQLIQLYRTGLNMRPNTPTGPSLSDSRRADPPGKGGRDQRLGNQSNQNVLYFPNGVKGIEATYGREYLSNYAMEASSPPERP